MIIGVLKEPFPETRVSLLPEHIAILKKWNVNVLIESGAGITAFAMDKKYEEAGAKITSRDEVEKSANIILSINQPSTFNLQPSTILLGVYHPLFNPELIKEWAEKNYTVFSMDMLPRTTRAQSMDVLSSQANIAGYKAVLTAANMYPKHFFHIVCLHHSAWWMIKKNCQRWLHRYE